MSDDQLSPHFKRSEFACRDLCGFDTPAPALVAGLELWRVAIGKPIMLTSGCRCAAHNKAVGGAPNSTHLPDKDGFGRAVDAKVKGMTAREMYESARKIPQFRAFGVDDQRALLHIDTRLVPCRWCYRDGKHGPWFEPTEAS